MAAGLKKAHSWWDQNLNLVWPTFNCQTELYNIVHSTLAAGLEQAHSWREQSLKQVWLLLRLNFTIYILQWQPAWNKLTADETKI